ncbi:MAG TPA: HAMP domain-containing sensor histidine kinase [Anaerolineales bacterium]|nr:HAMP domain-containing sensor histidine kinase [Anaerolineales bacterium]
MRSLAVKLTLAFLLIGLTGSILVAAIIQHRTRQAFNRFVLDRDQQALVDNLLTYYQANGSWRGVGINLLAYLNSPAQFPNDDGDYRRNWERFTLADANQVVIVSTQQGQTDRQLSERDLDQAIVLTVDGQTIGWLVLSDVREWVPNRLEALFLTNINRGALLSALIAILLAFALGGFLAFGMTRSLRELTEATQAIARGELGRQVRVRSQDEIGELAASFNQMSADLERATQARRQMTADIAHDLRSPLSVLSGYAEALNDGKLPGSSDVYAILHQESLHLSRLVEDLRLLSLADAGELPLTRQAISPQVVLERVAARHAVAAQQHGVTLNVQAAPQLPLIDIDVERMAQVFDNLVTNAFRYTPPGGTIDLAAQALAGSHGRPASVQMQVRDSGAGIDPQDLPHIFDRFYRGDSARQSERESGLGLAIARSIVEAHGGGIRVESSPGQGAVFTITLPAVP